FVLRHLSDAIERSASGASDDHKSRLQELVASRSMDPPTYEVRAEGPDHAKTFFARVTVGGTERGSGTGRSKKQAEQDAASAALVALGDPQPQNEADDA